MMIDTKIIRIPPDAELSLIDEALMPAAEIIRSGGLVAFPTETVYGLGADATSELASKKIYAAKGRPSDNPLIIHISTPEDAEGYTYTNGVYYKLARAFMPGPITVVLPSRETVPEATRGGLATVAVRCPSSRIANRLIKLSGVPIAAPSANLSGSPSPTTAEHVMDDMMGRIDCIVDGGASEVGLESTIVSVKSDDSVVLLRPGKITVEDIRALGIEVEIARAVTESLREGEIALSPGMKYRHYAPGAEVVLLDGSPDKAISYISARSYSNYAVICYSEDISQFESALGDATIIDFGNRDDMKSQARSLFDILRAADKQSYDIIFAPLPPTEDIGLALYNRMIRAAAHKIIRL